MSLRRVLTRRRGVLLPATLATLCVMLSVAVPSGWTATPAYTLEERALAISSPSLVFIEELLTGYLRDKTTHTALVASPVTYGRRCSGFVVHPDGYVATPGSCVHIGDAAVRIGALYAATELLIKDGKLDRAGRDAYILAHQANIEFTGLTASSAPDVRVLAQFNVATAGTTGSPAIPGEVVAVLEKSDVAILKLAQGNLPSVKLQVGDSLSQGAPLLAVGFATTDPDSRIGAFTLSSKAVQVTGTGKIGELSFSKINGDIGPFSSGGMAVDSDGHVVGMLNYDWTLRGTPVRAITPSSAVVEALGQVQATNVLGPADTLYRDGLDAYFRGDYSTAISQFDRVIAQSPANKTAATYRQQAADRQKIETSGSAVPVWVWIAAAAVVGALLAGAVTAVVLLGRRRRRDPDEADLLVPVSLNPFAPTSSVPFSSPPGPGPAQMYPSPPGVPVPMPPSVSPAAEAPPAPQSPAEPEPSVTSEPVETPMQASEPESLSEPFDWPEEEDNLPEQLSNGYGSKHNPA